MKIRFNFYIISTTFFVFLILPFVVYAQTSRSNCVITKIGNTGDQKPVLPPGCEDPSLGIGLPGGLLVPPNLTAHTTYPKYYQLPPISPDNSYDVYTCDNHLWGSKELVSVLYTVSKRWKQKYPAGLLYIGDLNATGHASHKWGRAVDLEATTNGTDMVADFTGKFGPYNRAATVELGKMFAETNMIQNIWFNDVSVNSEVLAFVNDPAHTNRSKGMVMQPITGHDNHFHLDVQLDPFLDVWEPGC